MSDKDANPKHGAGRAKPSMACTPDTAAFWWGLVHEAGAQKYGACNWRTSGVDLSVYLDAIKRHAAKIAAGEFWDSLEDGGTGAPHAACIMASAAIIIDAHAYSMLNEDCGSDSRPLNSAMENIKDIRACLGLDQLNPLRKRKD